MTEVTEMTRRNPAALLTRVKEPRCGGNHLTMDAEVLLEAFSVHEEFWPLRVAVKLWREQSLISSASTSHTGAHTRRDGKAPASRPSSVPVAVSPGPRSVPRVSVLWRTGQRQSGLPRSPHPECQCSLMRGRPTGAHGSRQAMPVAGCHYERVSQQVPPFEAACGAAQGNLT